MTDESFGSFYVGGHYKDQPGFGPVRVAQMYVEYHLGERTESWPIVFVHGGGNTGATYLSCADGRKGWAPFFVERGFAAYVVDWPGCGRSPYNDAFYGPTTSIVLPEAEEKRVTNTAAHRLWPQAKLSTQWPGSGRAGDPAFDHMMDGREVQPRDPALAQGLTRDALSALLDQIGPAVVVAHSAAGPIGWAIADARPDAVKALIQLEPMGPPVHNITFVGGESPYEASTTIDRPWALANVPLTYEPALSDPSELRFAEAADPKRPDRVRGWLQGEPVRRLPNLAGIPILIVTGEASYHAAYDHATSEYLTQAGVVHEHVRLEDIGIHGNGHKLTTEMNNLEIAEVVRQWIIRAVGG